MKFEEIFKIAENGRICSVFPEYTEGFLEELYDLGWTDKEVKRSLEGELERVNGNLKEYRLYVNKDFSMNYEMLGEDLLDDFLLDEVMIFHEDKSSMSLSRLVWDRFRGII